MNINKDEIGELWDKITPKLYGYLVNVLKDKTLADDILQATWLKAIESLPKFQDRGYGFSAWLFSIARNEMKMHWRKGGREIPYNNNLHDVASEEDSEIEQNIFLEQILLKLSENDRELIRLRYIADLSFSEISKILKINQVALRVKIHRALGRARIMLEEK